MKSEIRDGSFIALILLTVGLFLHRVGDFAGIRFVTADDIDFGVYRLEALSGDGPVSLAISIAREQGRISQLAQIPIAAFMANMASDRIYDLLNLGAFFGSVVLVGVMLSRLMSREFGLLFLVIFLAWVPQLWSHMPPAAYPVFPWVPLVFFVIAYCWLDRYFGDPRACWLVAFSVFFFGALFSYELFLLVFPLLAVAIAVALRTKHQAPRTVLYRALGSTGLVSALYAAAYFLWRMQYPTTYPGAQLSSWNPNGLAEVVRAYSVGGFPFKYLVYPYQVPYRQGSDEAVNIIAPYTVPDVFMKASVADLVAAAVAALIVAVLVPKAARRLESRALVAVAALSGVAAVLSLLLYGLTEKYSAWVAGGDVAYVGSRYAFIAWTVASCALAVLIFRLWGRSAIGRILFLCACALVFVGSVSASHLNYRVAGSMKLNFAKWRAVRAATGCDAFYGALKGQQVVAPRLWESAWYAHPRSDDYWNMYTSRVLRRPVEFVRNGSRTDALFDYGSSARGQLLGAFLGVNDAEGKVRQLDVLTDRNASTSMLLVDGNVERVVPLAWGDNSIECDRYMMNSVRGADIDFRSIRLRVPPSAPGGVVSPADMPAPGAPKIVPGDTR